MEGALLVLLVLVGLLGLVGVRRATRRTPSNPAEAFAQLVMLDVWSEGRWTNGDASVWLDSDGRWWLRDHLGTLCMSLEEVPGEIECLYYRQVAEAARESR